MRCAKECFFLIFGDSKNIGMPAPEVRLPKEHHGESHNVCELDTQPSNWEADTLSLGYHRLS